MSLYTQEFGKINMQDYTLIFNDCKLPKNPFKFKHCPLLSRNNYCVCKLDGHKARSMKKLFEDCKLYLEE